MSVIYLTTEISAPVDLVFDLSRSIDLHMISTRQTNETVEAGRTSGLCAVGDTITWRAKHLGFYQRLTVEIVRCDFPIYFEDRMVYGAFKSFSHRHYFEMHQTGTVMKDIFEFESPLSILGRLFNRILLKGYMTRLLLKRNEVIKAYAESADGQSLLKI
jgi:ligand-binding SRPBCC domain-containing protein